MTTPTQTRPAITVDGALFQRAVQAALIVAMTGQSCNAQRFARLLVEGDDLVIEAFGRAMFVRASAALIEPATVPFCPAVFEIRSPSRQLLGLRDSPVTLTPHETAGGRKIEVAQRGKTVLMLTVRRKDPRFDTDSAVLEPVFSDSCTAADLANATLRTKEAIAELHALKSDHPQMTLFGRPGASRGDDLAFARFDGPARQRPWLVGWAKNA